MTAGRGLALLCALGALPLAASVQKKPQNVATFVLPDGQVLYDGDTYATVIGSDGTEHPEMEHIHHIGYAQRSVGKPDAVPGDKSVAGTPSVANAEHVDTGKFGASPEELRGCEDTEGWVNGYKDPGSDLFDYWLEAEAEIEAQGHKGVMLWINGKGNTCAAYVFMGVCANLKWVDDKAEDWPCMLSSEMSGKEWNHPEENCCACGKAHQSKGAVCDNRTQIELWKHKEDMLHTVKDSFEGDEDERRHHWGPGSTFEEEHGAAGAIALLVLAAL